MGRCARCLLECCSVFVVIVESKECSTPPLAVCMLSLSTRTTRRGCNPPTFGKKGFNRLAIIGKGREGLP